MVDFVAEVGDYKSEIRSDFFEPAHSLTAALTFRAVRAQGFVTENICRWRAQVSVFSKDWIGLAHSLLLWRSFQSL